MLDLNAVLNRVSHAATVLLQRTQHDFVNPRGLQFALQSFPVCSLLDFLLYILRSVAFSINASFPFLNPSADPPFILSSLFLSPIFFVYVFHTYNPFLSSSLSSPFDQPFFSTLFSSFPLPSCLAACVFACHCKTDCSCPHPMC